MADPLRNFFKSQLIGEYSNTATSFTISTGDGALLPDPSVDGEYNLVIFEGTAGSSADEFEVVRVTAKSSDTLTVTRGQESTTPITVTSAFHSIIMAATKKTFDDINDAIDNVDLTTLTGVEELTFDSTGDEEFGLPVGTTAQRPASPSQGYMRYNTDGAIGVEVYNGSRWASLGGGFAQLALEVAELSVTANDAVFVPPLEVEHLVIAGGGGGGGSSTASALSGGGGGAGGYRSSVSGEDSGGGATAESTLSITSSTNYTVTIGAGGASTDEDDTGRGNPGSNSVFATITSTGGGGGGTRLGTESGGTGGSGGGGTNNSSGGSGTANQGFDGGDADTESGGGGGAGQVGQNAVKNVSCGAGGDGVESNITGTLTYRAGGGGGGGNANVSTAGSGGNGGGGAGGNDLNNGVDGTANTGGGGGGAGSTGGGSANTNSGAGGSGVVILRYPSNFSITIGAGLTGSETTVGANKVATITAGTGNVSWS